MSSRNGRKRVLFVCIGNACRSPMAEAIARHDASDAIEGFSAGLEPIGFVAGMTKQTLTMNGCWVEGLESKTISPELWERADIVINMSGRALELPFRERSKVEGWEIEDPFGEDPEVYQRVFERIRLRIAELAQRCRQQISEEASHLSPAAARTLPGAGLLATAQKVYSQTRKQSANETHPFRSTPARARWNRGLPQRKWGTFASLGVLIGLFSLTFEWLVIQRDVRTERITASTQKVAIQSDAVKPLVPLPVTTTPSVPNSPTEKTEVQASIVEHLPAEKAGSIQDVLLRHSPRPTNAAAKSSPSISVTTPSRPAENVLARGQLTNQQHRIAINANVSPVEKTQTRAASGAPLAPPQLEAKIAQPANLVPLSSNNVQPAEPNREGTSVTAAKQRPTPASVTAAVTIQADPYPSLRIPDGRSSKKQRQGTSLQLGHLLSRVEPVYPEEAKQQGIEGTVKIHAIIGRNGSVANLAAVNGPPILVASATSAVRQWRYTETLLAGHSVETEEDIDITFRLSNPTAPRK